MRAFQSLVSYLDYFFYSQYALNQQIVIKYKSVIVAIFKLYFFLKLTMFTVHDFLIFYLSNPRKSSTLVRFFR